MKTHEEMAHDALARIETYETEKTVRQKKFMRAAVPAVSLCLAAVIGIGVWQGGMIDRLLSKTDLSDSTETNPSVSMTKDPVQEQIPDSSEAGKDAAPTANNNADNAPVSEQPGAESGTLIDFGGTEDCAHWLWNDLLIYGDLKNALEMYPDGTFLVTASYRPTNVTSFTYEGKTVTEWADEAYEAYFAGETEQPMTEQYEKAFRAYMEVVMPEAVKTLTENGISCSRTKNYCNRLTLTVTADQLKNLPLADLSHWVFGGEAQTAGTDSPANDICHFWYGPIAED